MSENIYKSLHFSINSIIIKQFLGFLLCKLILRDHLLFIILLEPQTKIFNWISVIENGPNGSFYSKICFYCTADKLLQVRTEIFQYRKTCLSGVYGKFVGWMSLNITFRDTSAI